MAGSYLGPGFSDAQIAKALDSFGAKYEKLERDVLIDRSAKLLSEANVIGWFNGRMEFGPRALGSRSILGDPRSPETQQKMNLKIKFRESFRPFAPSVLEHRAADYFDLDAESPYMLLVSPVREERRKAMSDEDSKLFGIEKLNVPRSDVPAITHVDYSARVQTVSRDRSPDYFDLISKFDEYTGCPLVVNTSFNVRGEPIVCTPKDAYVCFMRTNMDYLVLGPYLLAKDGQPEFHEEGDWRDQFELD
jgi:carbamoyltransferase